MRIMTNNAHIELVTEFYNTHPISERQVLDKLVQDGFELSSLDQGILQDYDQDHFGGFAATDTLARLVNISRSTHILDVCCGLGGPARYLAYHYGNHVTGIDLNQSRVEGAVRLTDMVGLEEKVSFYHANALSSALPSDEFDALIAQEAFCHIANKPLLLTECVRLLKPGGLIAFTDILATTSMTTTVRKRLHQEMAFTELNTLDGYQALLKVSGCELKEAEDLSEEWARILVERLAMYRSLKDQTVARFGNEHFEKWDRAYSFFVRLYTSGELGGGRFLARKCDQADPHPS
jgi:cyclopropane fatty-acyl-phospholipid synthase-like methyltransferase